MVLKVIAAGTARTGAQSLVRALGYLGYGECFDKDTVAAYPESIDVLHEAYNGGRVDWRAVLGERYECIADFPASWFYEELLAAYPEAKVVLTVCDAEQWYTAARDTIRAFSPLMKLQLADAEGRLERLSDMIWDWIFELNVENKAKAIELYNKHVEAVKRAVPSNRLLVFDIKQGWQPLCEFLGVPVPDEKFPLVDERYAMLSMLENLRKSGDVPLAVDGVRV